jgi:hypothetical protein
MSVILTLWPTCRHPTFPAKDGSNHKSIDDFTLFNVLQVAINGADCPSTNNMLKQRIKMINHTFDFCKKVSITMELMQSKAAQMATYRSNIDSTTGQRQGDREIG